MILWTSLAVAPVQAVLARSPLAASDSGTLYVGIIVGVLVPVVIMAAVAVVLLRRRGGASRANLDDREASHSSELTKHDAIELKGVPMSPKSVEHKTSTRHQSLPPMINVNIPSQMMAFDEHRHDFSNKQLPSLPAAAGQLANQHSVAEEERRIAELGMERRHELALKRAETRARRLQHGAAAQAGAPEAVDDGVFGLEFMPQQAFIKRKAVSHAPVENYGFI